MVNERIEQLRRKFNRKKIDFILELSGTPIGIEEDIFDKKFRGANRYNQLRKDRNLPAYCNVLDNFYSPKRKRLLGDISSDCVYRFLLEVKESVEDIAYLQYPIEFKGRIKFFCPFDGDREMYVSGKRRFIENLLNFMEQRGQLTKSDPLFSGLNGRINSQERYEHLERIARDYFNGDVAKIQDFVEKCPAREWEKFPWPDERRDY